MSPIDTEGRPSALPVSTWTAAASCGWPSDQRHLSPIALLPRNFGGFTRTIPPRPELTLPVTRLPLFVAVVTYLPSVTDRATVPPKPESKLMKAGGHSPASFWKEPAAQ